MTNGKREEIREKLAYGSQLLYRLGAFYDSCGHGNGLRAERELRNILSFLLPDIRKKVKERMNPKTLEKIRLETKEELGKDYQILNDLPMTTIKLLDEEYRKTLGNPTIRPSEIEQRANECLPRYNHRVIKKFQKISQTIIEILNEEGLLTKSRIIGYGKEE